jgi:hypothetical protein
LTVRTTHELLAVLPIVRHEVSVQGFVYFLQACSNFVATQGVVLVLFFFF